MENCALCEGRAVGRGDARCIDSAAIRVVVYRLYRFFPFAVGPLFAQMRRSVSVGRGDGRFVRFDCLGCIAIGVGAANGRLGVSAQIG